MNHVRVFFIFMVIAGPILPSQMHKKMFLSLNGPLFPFLCHWISFSRWQQKKASFTRTPFICSPKSKHPLGLTIVLMVIWFCFPLYPLKSHIRSPSIRRRQQLGCSDITTVCLIQCFIVTDMAFSYLQGPLGNSFMPITTHFHISENPVLPNNDLL